MIETTCALCRAGDTPSANGYHSIFTHTDKRGFKRYRGERCANLPPVAGPADAVRSLTRKKVERTWAAIRALRPENADSIEYTELVVAFGEVVDEHIRAARASVEAQEDTARLDWLEAQIPTDVAVNLHATDDGKTIGLFCMAVDSKGDNLRAAIDDGIRPRTTPSGQRSTNGETK